MKDTDFLPKPDEQLLQWLKNFSDEIPTLGPSLGITPAEVASLKALIYDVKTDIRQGRKDKEDQEQKKREMVKFLNNVIKKVKMHSNYQESIHGQKLGILVE